MENEEAFFGGNERMRYAWQLIERCGANVFLTGKAGSGKTTFLRRLRALSRRNIVVTAPTGIAAVNAGGVTIHSFFQLPLQPFVPGTGNATVEGRRFERMSAAKLRLIRSIDLLVIDEVSMMRADVLDAIDESLRRHRSSPLPFGGVQLLLIGDLQQLAPVARQEVWDVLREHYDTEYFFSSHALGRISYTTVELNHIYRQNDSEFLRLLNRVRENTADASVLAALNRRVNRTFNPSPAEGYIRLVTHNSQAKAINDARLEALPGPDAVFTAGIDGEFAESSYPAEQQLVLRLGAQVMFLRNDPDGRFCNGTIGHVCGQDAGKVLVRVVADDGEENTVAVEPAEWQNTRFTLADDGHVKQEVAGTFRQLPLRLAWAVTVHKSQGLTFDRAIIDVSRSFAHGQTYVALSRCTSLGGLVLSAPLTAASIITDPAVAAYERLHPAQIIPDSRMKAMANDFYVRQLRQCFDLQPLGNDIRRMQRELSELARMRASGLTARYEDLSQQVRSLEQTAEKFFSVAATRARQHTAAGTGLADDAAFGDRIRAAADYFHTNLAPVAPLLAETPATSARLRERLNALAETLKGLSATLTVIAGIPAGAPVTIADLTQARAAASAGPGNETKKASQRSRKTQKTKVNIDVLDDPADTPLLDELKAWRRETALQAGMPPYVIAHDKALIAAVNAHPQTPAQLAAVPGWSTAKVLSHGAAVLAILALQ